MGSVWSSPERPAYPHQALAVVLQVRVRRLHVMLWERPNEPFAGAWALPGGPLLAEETLGASVARQLAAKVEVEVLGHLEQLETRSDPGRDPRGRTVATAYLGLIPAHLDPALPEDTAWHPVDALPPTAFDHGSMVRSALDRLRAKLSYTNVGFALAPPEFTIAELRELYVAALGYDVTATNLQRVLLRRGVLEPTGEQAASGRAGGRPAALHRFVTPELAVTDPFAVFRPPSRDPDGQSRSPGYEG
ncbi:NUDIX hydrolase [Blastococcus goldschmidtiae]|uniref:NUDIX domain-containing protein n=1 Tax=Blastococcus goldschmidtiae TaxID=3075546 RepID=A0ABU2K8H3_9ACTN|nr:NUDIX domain-containing protein [Blastococcus sp. DSM 46792]MDT0276489.1 NUDIX domain-containing protein [Blastococcus sp. DSM 46792]